MAYPALLVLGLGHHVGLIHHDFTELQDWTECLSQLTHLVDGNTEVPRGVPAGSRLNLRGSTR